MKHLVIGLVILALLLATSIGAVSLLENRAGQIVQELRLAEQALDQDAPALASDYARKAMDLWQHYSGFLGSILYHAEMDDINVHFAQLSGNAAAQDLGELRSTCAELIALVEHLPQMEKAYYFNIFAHCC